MGQIGEETKRKVTIIPNERPVHAPAPVPERVKPKEPVPA